MTEEEWERLKDSIRAKLSNKESLRANRPNEKVIESRRKLDRDLDRLERALKKCVEPDPQARQRMREEDKRWQEYLRASKERFAQISAIAARSDQKLKALIDDVRNDRNKRRP